MSSILEDAKDISRLGKEIGARELGIRIAKAVPIGVFDIVRKVTDEYLMELESEKL